jgi:putative hydrolase of the HAD superfamily
LERASDDREGRRLVRILILDMYGVIIKESKGNFLPYTYNHFPEAEHERITHMIRGERLFTKAGNGELTSDEFLSALGYRDTAFHMRDYIENHLTMDGDFYAFAENMKDKYSFALLSNDVSEWSRHITEFYRLDQYLPVKIVSGDVFYRKPDARIFEIALERLGVPAGECVFVDNSVENLRTAAGLGMDAVLFNRDGEEYDGKTVYSFGELERLLTKNTLLT